MMKRRICTCKDMKKPASLLDEFMSSSTTEQQLSLMEEEPVQVETPVKTILDNVNSVSDDAFMEGDKVKVSVKEENDKVVVDTNEAGSLEVSGMIDRCLWWCIPSTRSDSRRIRVL